MARVLRILFQAACYAVFAGVIAWFATSPAYRYGDPGQATIKIAISHATQRVEPCVRLTPEQAAALAANMRRSETCARQRLPLVLELDVDGVTVVRAVAEPAGLWNDGAASVYTRFDTAPGQRLVTTRLRESARDTGWDYEYSETVTLAGGRYFTVTFDPASGGFVYR